MLDGSNIVNDIGSDGMIANFGFLWKRDFFFASKRVLLDTL